MPFGLRLGHSDRFEVVNYDFLNLMLQPYARVLGVETSLPARISSTALIT
jgi:hypothetical protein